MNDVSSTFASHFLRGQLAVITGGSRGIGRATSLALARSGADLKIGYQRDQHAAEEVAHQAQAIGVRATAHQVDVSQPDQVYSFIEEVDRAEQTIDILVNCAGTWPQGRIEDLEDREWHHSLDVNLSGTYYTCKAVSKIMMARRQGKIVNFSSIAAVRGARSGHAHYAAAKGGVNSFTRTLANELGPYNINVNAVSPGVIRTDMTDQALREREDEYRQQTCLDRIGVPEDVAGAALFLVSPAAGYITGQTLHVNGGMWMA